MSDNTGGDSDDAVDCSTCAARFSDRRFRGRFAADLWEDESFTR